MPIRAAARTIAWRAAVSAIAGLLVSTFAAAALTLGPTSSDHLAVGRTISDALAPLFSAVAGAGLIASIVVFACLVTNDVLRATGRWLVAQRRWLILLVRAVARLAATVGVAIVQAIRSAARSTVVVEAIWLALTIGRVLAFALVSASVLAGCVLLYFGAITLGLVAIGESTRVVVAMLDDPPRLPTMALGLGGATVLMYIGISAFALCAWVTYRAARAGLQLAGRRADAAACEATGVALYGRWTSD